MVILMVMVMAPVMGIDPYPDLSDPDSLFFEAEEGVILHYKMSGEGEPVMVLLHGFGASGFSWRAVMEKLAEHNRVIAIDRTGFGLSSRPLELERYSLNPYSQVAQMRYMMRLVDQVAGPDAQVILVGHSAGGAVAALTALEYPHRVERLILVAPALFSGRGPSWSSVFQDTQLSLSMPIVKAMIARQFEDLLMSSWHDPSGITPNVVEGYKKPLLVPDWEKALQAFTEAQQDIGLGDRLDQLQLPVLIINGDQDQIVPLPQAQRAHAMIEGSKLVVMDRCGHLPHEEYPEIWLSQVKSFLRE